MAFPNIEDTADTNHTTPDTDHIVDLPGTIVDDNLLLMIATSYQTGTSEVSITDDWYKILAVQADGQRLWIFAKKGAALESNPTITFPVSTKFRSRVYEISGWRDHVDFSMLPSPGPGGAPSEAVVWAFPVSTNQDTSATNNQPDAPSSDVSHEDWIAEGVDGLPIVPPLGVTEILWFTIFVSSGPADETGTLSVSSYPSGYTGDVFLTEAAADYVFPHLGIAFRQRDAAIEDAGVFTLNENVSWVATTIAIPPPALAPSGSVVLSETVSITDDVSRIVKIEELVSIIETMVFSSFVSLQESVTITDSISTLKRFLLTENVSITDAVARFVPITENMTIEEVLRVLKELSGSTDRVSIGDSVKVFKQQLASYEEPERTYNSRTRKRHVIVYRPRRLS